MHFIFNEPKEMTNKKNKENGTKKTIKRPVINFSKK
jgi:hypothetical protein